MAYSRVTIITKGYVLITILLLNLLIVLLSHTAMETSILQIKMVNNLKSKLQLQEEVHQELTTLENNLRSATNDNLPSQIKLIQFVPDTLHFAEKQGTYYYCLEVKKDHADGSFYQVKSTYALRKLTKEKADIVPIPLNIALPSDWIIQKPEIIKLANNEWKMILPIYSLHTKQHAINIYDLESGQLRNNIELPLSFSHPYIIAVDQFQTGICDGIYVIDQKAGIGRIDVNNHFYLVWPLFVENYSFGNHLLKPIIGHHPHDEKMIMYLQDEEKNSALIFDETGNMTTLFAIHDLRHINEMQLRKGRLILYDGNDDQRILIYDAYNGKLLKNEKVENKEQGLMMANAEINQSTTGRRTWEIIH